MKLFRILGVSAVALGIAVPALAGPVGVARPSPSFEQVQMLAQLNRAKERDQREARMMHGSGEQLRLMKVVAIDNMIEKIKSGETVSKEEVNQLIRD